MKNLAKKTIMLVVCGFFILTVIGSLASGQQTITLKYWKPDNPAENDLDKAYIDQFMTEHPNIRVKFHLVVGGDESTPVMLAFAGGTGPDLFPLNYGFFRKYMSSELLSPIDLEVFGASSYQELSEGWEEGALDVWKYGNDYYGIPKEFSCYALSVNSEHFKEAGLDPERQYPRTWVAGPLSMASIGQKLAKIKNGKIVRQGFTISSMARPGTMLLQGMIRQLGSDFVTPDGRSNINSPAVRKVFQTMYDFIYKYRISVPPAPPVHRAPGFESGDASMNNTCGVWYGPFLREVLPELYQKVIFKPTPRFLGGLDGGCVNYGYALHVSTSSKHKKEAWTLAKFLSSFPLRYMEYAGLFQPRKSWIFSKGAQSYPRFYMWLQEYQAGGWWIGEQPIVDIMYSAFTRTLAEKMPPEESLAIADEELSDYLSDLPYTLKAWEPPIKPYLGK